MNGSVDFLPLPGTFVGDRLSQYLNGLNNKPFQAPDNGGGSGGMGGDTGPNQISPLSPFTPSLLPTQGSANDSPPPEAPAPPSNPSPTHPHAPGYNPYLGPNQGGGSSNGPRRPHTVTRYDGQQQNPLMWLLEILYNAGRPQRPMGNRNVNGIRPGRGAVQDRSGTPLQDAANRYFILNQLNRTGGWSGESNTPGGGNFMGGFYRSFGPNDPGNGTGRVYGPGPNVGYTGYMRGGLPSQRENGFQNLDIMTGRPSPNSMESWLGDFFRQQSGPYAPGSNWPMNIPEGAHGPGGDSMYQQSWRDFFNRGSSLENMDASFRGEYGGTGRSDMMWLV